MKEKVSDNVFLFYGAGTAATGVAELLMSHMSLIEGVPHKDTLSRIFMIDSKGLIYDRPKVMNDSLNPKRPFCHTWETIK